MSLINQLSKNITELVITQITAKLLPAISEKYDISMDELMLLVEQKTSPKIIKALPKSSTSSVTSSTSVSRTVRTLNDKIAEAKSQNKLYNVSTGKMILDNPGNRRTYTVYDNIGIAGKKDDPKLLEAIKELDKTRSIPVHIQASNARKKAKQESNEYTNDSDNESESVMPKKPSDNDSDNEPDNEPDNDSDSDNEPESVMPKKPAPKKVVRKQSESDNEPESVMSKKPAPKKVVRKQSESDNEPESVMSKKPAPKKVVRKQSDSDNEPENVMPKKPAPKKVVKKQSESDNEPESVMPKKTAPKKVVKKPSDNDNDSDNDKSDGESIDNVKKISQMLEEEKGIVKYESNSKGVYMKTQYNNEFKSWIVPEKNYLVKKYMGKPFIYAKISGNSVVPLSKQDLEQCEKNKWSVNTEFFSKYKKNIDSDDED